MNRWTGIGHLTRDPELIEVGDVKVGRLRIGVKRGGRRGRDGFFDVTCFDRTAENCARYLKSGRAIAVDGRLQFDEFETAAGDRATRIVIVADRVDFLPSAARADDAPSRDGETGGREARAPSRPLPDDVHDELGDAAEALAAVSEPDDIPF